VLRANHAVRLGLRAASRNPELPFAKALLDQAGNVLAVLPLVLAGLLVAAALQEDLLLAAALIPRVFTVLSWPIAGAILAAIAVGFTASMLFWAGALPLLAADAEMNRRPPRGNFIPLLGRGAARTIAAGALGWGMSLLLTLCLVAALLFGAAAAAIRPSAGVFVGMAAVGASGIPGAILVDLLGRLTLVRAAAFGDPLTVAVAKAASLLGQRLGALLVVTGAFVFLELIVASVATAITGALSGTSLFDPGAELVAMAPRAAVGVAAAAVFAWLEVGRMGALAAIVADAEGLIEPPTPAEPPPVADLVVEALPADEA